MKKERKEREVKEVKVGAINKEDFENWCEKNGRDPEHKLSFMKYVAEVKKNKEVEELYNKVKNGEVSLEDVELQNCEEKEEKLKRKITEDKSKISNEQIDGLKMILLGITRMACSDEKAKEFTDKGEEHINELIKKFYDTKNVNGLEVLVKGVICNYGDFFAEVLDNCLKYLREGQKICDLSEMLRAMINEEEENEEGE